ncbi:NAD(P)/FAD-dependent oxidoreductase [Prosthecomicrobium sp. N25]|uniref:NAD(P)/FAD-dependent oxidoreductase n=1 Tax=Prosthecomicrobium sp. N25 TaxID=3129254 RepID=UPI003077A6C0
MKVDVIVLGAGMVGVSAALALQKRGRSVLLVDRGEPGEETSFGNAGVIEREGFVPVAFPRKLKALLRYGLNLSTEAHYHPAHLPKVVPWLMALRRNTDLPGIEAYAAANDLLCRHAVAEHRALAAEAGAERYFRQDGWIRLYRSAESYAEAGLLHRLADQYGVSYRVLEPAELAALEPHLRGRFHKAVLWPESDTVSWPGGVVKAYAELFRRLGGKVARGDARSLARAGDHWTVHIAGGSAEAPQVVAALGAWTTDLTSRLGLSFPLVPKRGYHMHFGAEGNAVLTRPVVDNDYGYVLTPMERGIRLTTGIEFADRDAPPTPRQLERLRPIARGIFPLAEDRDAAPWLGRRPALPDSLPVIGAAPGVPGLWLDFGHGHLGFTQGPISGRLLADLVTGEPAVVDPKPFRAERFFRA